MFGVVISSAKFQSSISGGYALDWTTDRPVVSQGWQLIFGICGLLTFTNTNVLLIHQLQFSFELMLT
jgi:hypothetical protein